jgi:glycosyltransferase involved in cell wall biosynthesis
MRILQLVHAFPPMNNGGTELYTLRLSLQLISLGHEVEVVYPVFDPNLPPYSFSKISYQGLTIHVFNGVERQMPPQHEYYSERFDGAFRNFLKDNPYDIYHFQHLVFLSSNWPAIARDRGGKIVLKIDDMYFTCTMIHLNRTDGTACTGPDTLDKCYTCVRDRESDGPGAPARDDPKDVALLHYFLAYRRERLRQVYSQFDFVHSASRFLVDHFHKYGLQNGYVRHIATGITRFEPLPRTRSPMGKLRVGFVGHIDTRKGIWVFLRAVQCYRDQAGGMGNLEFSIHGEAPSAIMIKKMNALLAQMPGVEYRGGFNQDTRDALFAGLDIMVVPSMGENYPFIIREALHAGLPVISTQIAGIPEIIKPGVNGFLFPSGDFPSLAAIFSEVSAKPEILGRFQFPGFPIKFAAEEAMELTEIFSDLMQGKPARPVDNAVAETDIHRPPSGSSSFPGNGGGRPTAAYPSARGAER